jgi:hypothetical protein
VDTSRSMPRRISVGARAMKMRRDDEKVSMTADPWLA